MNIRIMEVCGTHTSSIARNGIRSLLPEDVSLVSGPGCPVCVTPAGYIDKLIAYSNEPGQAVTVFGDMLRVPGSSGSLASAGRASYVYSPFDVINRAEREPETGFIFGAAGFETTAAVYAGMIDEIIKRNIKNIRLLTAIKTMPPAMDYICANESIGGFICPGHVCAVIGAKPFEALARRWQKPMVISGFSGEQIMNAIKMLINIIRKPVCINQYTEVVRHEGNEKALELMEKYLVPGDAYWRGIGLIEGSGLYLRPEYAFLDAGSADCNEEHMRPGCRCGDIMLGRMTPGECPLFGRACTPPQPVGACMVSSEGPCYLEFTTNQ